MAPRLLVAPAMLEVAIVSANPETLDGLSSYFGAAGIRTRCARRLADCSRSKATAHAFVFFPDDFAAENVVATINALAADRPAALPVLVTAHPKSYEQLAGGSRVVIVPRPAWASAILDAVRAHVEESP
jgi:hypothetical protein